MEGDRTVLNSLEASLSAIFTSNDWNQRQLKPYTMIHHYANHHKENDKKYQLREDKVIIRNNFKDQLWYNYSKSKPILNQLLDSMVLHSYTFTEDERCLNFQVVIQFESFSLHACVYHNYLNRFLNYHNLCRRFTATCLSGLLSGVDWQ